MRKIFRMQYEPCNGLCYTAKDVVKLTHLGDNRAALKHLLMRMVEAHEPLCGNVNLAYGIDFDETQELFIASFQHYGKLELFADKDLVNVLYQLCDAALKHYDSDAGKAELASNPGLGHDVCEHGKDLDLIRFMVEHSGIPTPDGIDSFLVSAGIKTAA